MKYKAVIFDLFGTLVLNLPLKESENVLRQMASALSAPSNDFIGLWHSTFYERMKGIFQNYQACIRFICTELKVPIKDKQVELAAKIRFDMTRREVMTLRTDAVEVLSYLKSEGYKTGLISNCSFEAIAIWEETPLAPLIDAAVFSCLVGVMKPDPHIYHIVVGQLAIRPENCLYVADGVGKELTGALKVGMHPVLIRIPYEDYDDPYREGWDGPMVSSLSEVLALVQGPT